MSEGPRVWLDGRVVAAAAARIDPADRGLLLGDGLFETMRARGGAVPLLERHLARLRRGAGLLGIPLPLAGDEIERAVRATLAANGLEDAAVRLTLTRGRGPRGLPAAPDQPPTLLIAAFPLPAPRPPARVIVAKVTRRNERSPLSRLKTLGYGDSLLALREARARGADDALLLNTAERLACATAANLFILQMNTLATPPPGEGALAGITRALVLESAGRLGLQAVEEPLLVAELATAEEVFLSSALQGLLPVIAVDGRPVGTGVPGPRTAALQAAWLQAQG
jgi:branched-chain amino acid aminotransferase